jgi:hypothetical protein
MKTQPNIEAVSTNVASTLEEYIADRGRGGLAIRPKKQNSAGRNAVRLGGTEGLSGNEYDQIAKMYDAVLRRSPAMVLTATASLLKLRWPVLTCASCPLGTEKPVHKTVWVPQVCLLGIKPE